MYENGKLLGEIKPFESGILIRDFSLTKIRHDRIANKSWLRYSQKIAMQMLDKMEQMKITQKQLAERMNCSQQYISKILKGKENLSLETLTKIENALEG